MKWQVAQINFLFPPSFMGRGVIDKPLNIVSEFIKDIQSSFIWDNFLVVCLYNSISYLKKAYHLTCPCRMLDM
jgi:hypothetical protein